MTTATTPPSSNQPARRSLQLLQQISDTLGIGIDTFRENSTRHLFHVAEHGTRWFLVPRAEGQPVVRQAVGSAECVGTGDETAARFLAMHLQTPQGQALEALIDRLLVSCLR